MKLKWFIGGAIVAAVLQSAALGKIIFDRADLIRNGREVVLQSGMVDPRDLFRGHYVTLNLTISSIDGKDVKLDKSFSDAWDQNGNQNQFQGRDVYVSLKKGENEFWVPDTLYAAIPKDTDKPFIRGEYRRGARLAIPGPDDEPENMQGTHILRFPIDRFFAEKSRAKDLEEVRRDRNLGVVVALSDTGEAAIKGISVEGELIYVESVW